MKVSALIPVKGFAQAKQRLSPSLGAPERAVLAEAMLRDVLGQAASARGLESIFVVTADSMASEIASSMGAQVIQEKEERGETDAVVFGLGRLKQRGIWNVLIMPADIPAVRSSDIELLLQEMPGHNTPSPFVLLIPSEDRMGTNALLLSPPDVIRLRFGYDSFSYHLSEVFAHDLPVRILHNERIGLDIDRPEDLQRFLSAGSEGETYRALLRMEAAAGPEHKNANVRP
jgi:2-phospho-L-lactate guanylyltransferase